MSSAPGGTRVNDGFAGRMVGVDVARALAILGMILVNFRTMTFAEPEATQWLELGIDRIEGKAAALFVVLAGVGISLRTASACRTKWSLRQHQIALLRRATVLFVVGLVNLHMWTWDILHCYGLFLFVAVFLIEASSRQLLALAAMIMLGATELQAALDYDEFSIFWDARGALRDMFFNGLFPLFPWFAFLLVGMWLGRLDLRDRAVRWCLISVAGPVLFTSEVFEHFARERPETFGADLTTADWLRTWPRPPKPLFVIAGSAFAILTLALSIEVAEPRRDRPWVGALVATGQMAFTLYIAHAIAILIPLSHGLLEDAALWEVMFYGVTVYAACVAGCVWWRRRWPHGPLEALFRQVTSGTPATIPEGLRTNRDGKSSP